MAKKKKAAGNPARGYATTSIPSKPRAEQKLDLETPTASQSAGRNGDKTDSPTSSGGHDATANPNDRKELNEMSPEEMEQELERNELQNLVNSHAAKVRRESTRQVVRAHTETRVVRAQATSLGVSMWLSSDLTQRILDLAVEDMQHNPQAAIDADDKPRSDDELALKLWTLQLSLAGLSIPEDQVDLALRAMLEKPPATEDSPYIWGLQESLEFLALQGNQSSLPDFEHQKNPRAPALVEDDASVSDDDQHSRSDPVPASEPPSVMSTEDDNTPDVTDLDSDLEPDELLSKYLQLKVRLFEIQPDKKPKKAASKQLAPGLVQPQSRVSIKLQQQIAKIEADVLFDKREGESQWNVKQNQLLQEDYAHRRLNLAPRLVDIRPGSENTTSGDPDVKAESDARSVTTDEAPDLEGEDLMRAMFTEPSGPGDGNNATIDSSGVSVTIRDFGQSTGLSPRRILEDACRSRDSTVKLVFKLVSPTTYSARHSVLIRWTKPQEPVLALGDVDRQQRRLTMKFTMITISAVDTQQSESFVSVAALFSIFSTSQKEEKVYMRLPPVWRDVWQELAAAQKEKNDAVDREALKEMRLLVQGKRERDEDGGVVLASHLRSRNRSPEKQLVAVNDVNPVSGEELQNLWNRKVSTSSYMRMQPARQNLPIAGYRAEILSAIAKHQVTILCGETGCGKSTQLPAYILEDELSKGRPCKIYCTQPRRISAISLAQRVSEELGEARGAVGSASSLIGYAIRLESHVSEQTYLIYATVGIVLRMLESAQGLRGVTHLIVDEVHERSIDTDFLLVIIKAMLESRPDLRVVLMSATVDAQKFSSYLDGAPILTVPGRTFPVETLFLEDALELTKIAPVKNENQESDDDFDVPAVDKRWESKFAYRRTLTKYSKATVEMLMNDYDEYRIDYELIMRLIEEVSVNPQFRAYSKAFLVFLPGIAEIRELNDILRNHEAFGADWLIYPLHSTIASEEQQQAFVVPSPGVKKVVLATNIAETGITIPDITCVIDSGKHKEMRFDERRQLSRLLQAFISRSNAKQRRGRAGRVQEGLCFHLFSKYRHDNLLAENQTPELLRLSLQDLVMRVKICKLGNIEETLAKALDPPLPKNVRQAIDALIDVGALTSTESLTPLGRQLAKLPLDTILGKLCLLSSIFDCVDAAVTIAAILSSKSPFVTPFGARSQADATRLAFQRGDSDLLTAYNAYVSWRKVCTTPGQSEFQFCRRNFLSSQNLGNIEDVKSQLLSSLVEAGCLQLSRDERQALSRYRYSSRHRLFVPVPAAFNTNNDKNDLVNAVIAWAFYPKLLTRDGNGWRNVANSQAVSLHPSSVNKGTTTAKFLSYYSIMQSASKHYNAHSTSLAHDLPLALLAGHADFRLHAGVMIVDGNRLRFSFRDWKSMVAVKILRSKAKDIVNARLKSPGRPLGQKLERWRAIVQSVFDARDALEKKERT